jgi:hypothetical protein
MKLRRPSEGGKRSCSPSELGKKNLVFLSEFGGSGGAPTEGEQGGESPAFRAGKGQLFPRCEPRKGRREALEVKKHQVLLLQGHSLL